MQYRTLLVDVYGTLIDPMSVADDLATIYSLRRGFAEEVTDKWHEFRSGYISYYRACGDYRPFWYLTIYALRDALSWYGLPDASEPRKKALEAYGELSLFSDVQGKLTSLNQEFERVYYLTNANPEMIEVLKNHGTLVEFDGVISAHDSESFLPARDIVSSIPEQVNGTPATCLLLSSHIQYLQVASLEGIHTAWLNRDYEPLPSAFDPPDQVVGGVPEFMGNVLENP